MCAVYRSVQEKISTWAKYAPEQPHGAPAEIAGSHRCGSGRTARLSVCADNCLVRRSTDSSPDRTQTRGNSELIAHRHPSRRLPIRGARWRLCECWKVSLQLSCRAATSACVEGLAVLELQGLLEKQSAMN